MAAMSDKVAEISDPTHHTSLMTSLRAFINTESFIDVQFVCQGGHKVYAHKLMLISVSRLLKKLLSENPYSNEMITIHLPEISSKLLRIVVNFLYIGFMRLNSTEMDQFKMVLNLLDIELFQKTPDAENSSNINQDNLRPSSSTTSNISASNNASYGSNSGPGSVNNSAIPVVNRICPPQNVSTEYIQVAQPSHVAGVPIENGPHQYIAIRTDQLGIPNNRGEVMVSYSAVPIHPGLNTMVGQPNTVNLPSGHQTMLQDQSHYNTFTSSAINSSTATASITTNPASSNMVPISSSQVNIQHASQLPVQNAGQQMVRLVPAAQNQTVLNNNSPSFSNMPSETSCINNSQFNNIGTKRKATNFVKPSLQPTNLQDVIIDLSDDDVSDYKSTDRVTATPSHRQRGKVRKSPYSTAGGGGGVNVSSNELQSASPSSSSASVTSHSSQRNTTPVSSQPEFRNKRRKDDKVVDVDFAKTKSGVNFNKNNRNYNDNFNKTL